MDISTGIITVSELLNTWNKEKWTEYKEIIKNEFKVINFKLSKSIIQQLPKDME